MSEDREKEIRILEKQALECADVEELISDYIDDELIVVLKARVASHLNHCEKCRECEEDTRSIIILAKTLQRPVPQDVRRRLREKLNQTLGLNLQP